MTTLSQRTIVHCSVNQAHTHLARFFRIRGNHDGDCVKLELRADVALPGNPEGLRAARTVIATLSPLHHPAESLPQYGIIWATEHGGPYPTFDGRLSVESGDDYSTFFLVLDGTYEPPLGALGTAFDAVVGHRIAESTARHLLTTIADSIEADFERVEAQKAQARGRVMRADDENAPDPRVPSPLGVTACPPVSPLNSHG